MEPDKLTFTRTVHDMGDGRKLYNYVFSGIDANDADDRPEQHEEESEEP